MEHATWYGNVYAFQNGEGWIYSAANHDYQYVTGDGTGVWIYDAELGWYWTSEDFYPYIYLSRHDAWAYFYPGSGTDAASREYYLWVNVGAGLPNYPYATAQDLDFDAWAIVL
jgi:hypothetical protein